MRNTRAALGLGVAVFVILGLLGVRSAGEASAAVEYLRGVTFESGTSGVTLHAKYGNPGDVARSLDITAEIVDGDGAGVAKWTSSYDFEAGEAVIADAAWDTSGAAAGTYTVKQSVVDADGKALDSNESAATLTLGEGGKLADDAQEPAAEPGQAEDEDEGATGSTGTPSTGTPSTGNSGAIATSEFYGVNEDAVTAAASLTGEDKTLMEKMAETPTADWIGDWVTDPSVDVAANIKAAGDKTAVMVLYAIPNRDCGSYSAGKFTTNDQYTAWIKQVAAGLGDGKAMLILEPDALAQLCDNDTSRYDLISGAVDTLTAADPNAMVYIDIGTTTWPGQATAIERLKASGIEKARGFSLNVSNFKSTEDNVTYGDAIAKELNTHYVVDTSRNGNPGDVDFCNPAGMAAGQQPTTETGSEYADAFLWIKIIGQSDGDCNGGPAAGEWYGDYALGLAKAAWG